MESKFLSDFFRCIINENENEKKVQVNFPKNDNGNFMTLYIR